LRSPRRCGLRRGHGARGGAGRTRGAGGVCAGWTGEVQRPHRGVPEFRGACRACAPGLHHGGNVARGADDPGWEAAGVCVGVACPRCRARMTAVAVVQDPHEVVRHLAHTGEATGVPVYPRTERPAGRARGVTGNSACGANAADGPHDGSVCPRQHAEAGCGHLWRGNGRTGGERWTTGNGAAAPRRPSEAPRRRGAHPDGLPTPFGWQLFPPVH
jgi:hypothetical protein